MQDFEINVLLLVEDSEDDIIITQRKLFKSSVKVKDFLVAHNLAEGIEAVNHVNIDVVLLDLNLPETRGLDTLHAFQKEYNGIIVVLTSIDDEMIGIQAIRDGADDYLVKSSLSELSLARSILYARERRKFKTHLAGAADKIDTLSKLLGD